MSVQTVPPILPAFLDIPGYVGQTGPAYNFLQGNIYYVNSSNLNSSGTGGTTPGAPFSTLQAALSACIPNNGDVIICLPGHVEVVNSAGSDGGTGRVQWTMRYKPLAPGVVVI